MLSGLVGARSIRVVFGVGVVVLVVLAIVVRRVMVERESLAVEAGRRAGRRILRVRRYEGA